MTRLELSLRFDAIPNEIIESWAFHRYQMTTTKDHEQNLSVLLDNVVQLLQHPQSRLQVLKLTNIGIDDRDFLAVAQWAGSPQLRTQLCQQL